MFTYKTVKYKKYVDRGNNIVVRGLLNLKGFFNTTKCSMESDSGLRKGCTE